MAEYKVLITTSGMGSRLGDLTKYTNKSLVRIGNKPAISHIIESYPEETKFVITIGHYGQHIQDFLEMAYPQKSFDFVNVDIFDGEGSSLIYSLLCAKDKINCPFIFHVGDAIIKDHNFKVVNNNWVAGYKKNNSSQYRTFNVDSKKVTHFNEKGELNHDYVYVGVAGIKDYKDFWEKLEHIYSKDKLNRSLSDVHVIRDLIKTKEINYIEINNWYDIGNTSELQKTRSKFPSDMNVLDKIDENIFMFENFVIKFFSDPIIAKNRAKRGKILEEVTPKILDYKNNFFKYEKSVGNLFSRTVTPKKFKYFLDWLDKYLWTNENTDLEEKNHDFYFNKTNERINKYFDKFNENSKIINGSKIPTISDLLSELNKEYMCKGISSRIHGDLILDNVIETENGFSLIDWRQDFAGELETGDIYYDLAKLNHNLIFNHFLVESGNFKINEKNKVINCDILVSKNLLDCREILHKFIVDKGYDLKKVKILTAIIWINMAPLHEYPLNKFLFNFGKYNLFREIDQK